MKSLDGITFVHLVYGDGNISNSMLPVTLYFAVVCCRNKGAIQC